MMVERRDRRRRPPSGEDDDPDLDTVTLATLRAYVQALGGRLRVVADFGDREFRLT